MTAAIDATPPRARPKPLVSLRGVTKTFSNGTTALAGLDMDIADGEFLSLLGPSGCGKSTVLRMLAGLSEPSGGTIDWKSATYDAAGRPEMDMSFVFQEATLMPWATVARNVWLPLRLKGQTLKVARPKIDEALEMVGLGGFAEAYPRELSGGMKMRVSIARALVTRPKILLMDEPFAALDEITRQKLNDDLLHLWQTFGWTVVFVTHSVFESVYLSQRVVVMAARPGRVVDDLAIERGASSSADYRTTEEYRVMCQRASASLLTAIGKGTPDE
ncbi:Aliphatic sulfonates import ATP-binding protein SsuB [Hartmannibacter diazotrophicus]|uniref:Aliphatic sulfonates import ATP-binding protein SsuB n=1 Tax=Hartmannibacter diazotrophicus TaxID=1482074 RepID=A0A2C9DEA1_9HYPH|nr:ABC transporter ATP-binding protein [Hartmannibacter diazotrophicus]SON58241.1 Aliphatic sulfonates import ATP-binding protein SsuB [Hartmannibacter diazotrophicus]